MLRLTGLLVSCLILASCATTTPARNSSFKRVTDGRTVGFEQLITDIRHDPLIFVGELHDNRAHHELQLEVIMALHRARVPLVIGLEMFSYASQPALDGWISGNVPLDEFMKTYQENWKIPWLQYEAILLFAKENGIPLIGLNVPKEIVQKVNRFGFASLSTEEKKYLPQGITCRIDTAYMKFVKSMFAGHNMGRVSFEHFCEAQSVRNQTMAWLAVEYLRKHPEQVMVVISGIGHAIKRAVPGEIELISKTPFNVIIPFISSTAMGELSPLDADYLMVQ